MAIANGDLKKGKDVIIKNGKSFSDSADNTVNAAIFRRIFANVKENFKEDFPFSISEYYCENIEIPYDKSKKMLLYKYWKSKFSNEIESGVTKSKILKTIKKEANETIKDGIYTYHKYIVDNQEIIVNTSEVSYIVGMLVKQDNEKIEKIKQKFREHKD